MSTCNVDCCIDNKDNIDIDQRLEVSRGTMVMLASLLHYYTANLNNKYKGQGYEVLIMLKIVYEKVPHLFH